MHLFLIFKLCLLYDLSLLYQASTLLTNVSNWTYSYIDNISIFTLVFTYLNLTNQPSTDTFDFFFFNFWIFNWTLNNYQLFWSVLLDNYILNLITKNYFTDEWFKTLLHSPQNSAVFFFHPELFFLNFSSVWANSNFILAIKDNTLYQGFFLSVFLIPQLFLTFLFVLFFISFYFSSYSSLTKEETMIDSDFLIASLTVEAEKEITAIDDIILGFVLIIYIFVWFFFLHCWSILLVTPDFSLTFYALPCLWVTILFIPTFLLYDFGIFFVAYLRGVAPTALLIAELMFDYIAVMAFYIRLIVQGVRMVLMFLTYISLHDFILFFFFDQNILLTKESVWFDLNSQKVSGGVFTYFLLTGLPGQVLYWVYELLHTFFVVVAQTTAFFAMVFWLFLFLYTFFVSERQEVYFFDKRLQKQTFLQKINMLRN